MEIHRDRFVALAAKLAGLCEDAAVSDERPVPAAAPWAEPWRTIGVTGTNGKTSTTALAASAVLASGRHVFWSSTLGYCVDGVDVGLPRSWGSFLDAAEQCDAMGGRHAVVEVTSQALARGYAKRWRYDIGVFTNLSPDHFKTHGSWEHYLASKAQLFVHLPPDGCAVFNARDRSAGLIDAVTPPEVRRLWYGVASRGEAIAREDLGAAWVKVTRSGTEIGLRGSPLAEELGGLLKVGLVGEVFAENALAAACAAHAAGIEGPAIAVGMRVCGAVPGRFEVLSGETGPVVAVDYAHTPDALARTCDTARALAGSGRVIVVFGAGGDTDAGKRGPMGEAVGTRADVAVITTDNPRNEPAGEIAGQLAEGVRRGGRAAVRMEADRRTAIALAIASARAGDVVVVAGKGHELGQTIGEETLPFSDRDEVRALTGRATEAA